MPTATRCCTSWSKRQGREPKITVGQDDDGQWWAIVGSSMFSGYDDREELMLDAERDQATQTIFPCGHVLRHRAARETEPLDG